MEGWMTQAEAMKALRVSALSLWRWRRDGKLVAHKLPGGGLRYREQDLLNVLERESVTAT